MRRARWHLRAMLITIATSGVLFVGAIKFRRYRDLRQQIAVYQHDEERLLEAYHEFKRILAPCGNAIRQREAYAATARIMKAEKEKCKRELARIW